MQKGRPRQCIAFSLVRLTREEFNAQLLFIKTKVHWLHQIWSGREYYYRLFLYSVQSSINVKLRPRVLPFIWKNGSTICSAVGFQDHHHHLSTRVLHQNHRRSLRALLNPKRNSYYRVVNTVAVDAVVPTKIVSLLVPHSRVNASEPVRFPPSFAHQRTAPLLLLHTLSALRLAWASVHTSSPLFTAQRRCMYRARRPSAQGVKQLPPVALQLLWQSLLVQPLLQSPSVLQYLWAFQRL